MQFILRQMVGYSESYEWMVVTLFGLICMSTRKKVDCC